MAGYTSKYAHGEMSKAAYAGKASKPARKKAVDIKKGKMKDAAEKIRKDNMSDNDRFNLNNG